MKHANTWLPYEYSNQLYVSKHSYTSSWNSLLISMQYTNVTDVHMDRRTNTARWRSSGTMTVIFILTHNIDIAIPWAAIPGGRVPTIIGVGDVSGIVPQSFWNL